MMKQWWEIKSQHPDKLVLFRLGDFYELFYDDAVIASKELELTLTARESKHERVPMCGVPYHAVETYLTRLIQKGYKVALCEQVEDPRQSKGLVRREVVKVITPGTFAESGLLGDRSKQYLTAVAQDPSGNWGLASTDLLTGQCIVTEFTGPNAQVEAIDELHRLSPAELLIDEAAAGLDGQLAGSLAALDREAVTTRLPSRQFDQPLAEALIRDQFGAGTLMSLKSTMNGAVLSAIGALLNYLQATQKSSLDHLLPPSPYRVGDYLVLDIAARRHLELTRRWSDGEKSRKDTLLGILDLTRTAMGSRRLQDWIEQPLTDAALINGRLDAVEALFHDTVSRLEIRDALQKVYDLERLAGRIAMGTVTPRELAALRRSLHYLPSIKESCQPAAKGVLAGIVSNLDVLDDIRDLLDRALVDDPPATLAEGGVLRDGFNKEVDRLRSVARDGKSWLARLEQDEREQTGIKSLKIGYNRVFGYYLEVTHANRHLVPPHYERRQTLVNSERYVTPRLKELESEILGAEERLIQLEQELFSELRARIASQIHRLQQTANAVAQIDALASLAQAAADNGYTRPRLYDDLRLKIINGRHPVLERKDELNFVPNDTVLDGDDQPMAIVTGPNMGGKSTYLRQVALIVIMAQMGSFVPADEAEIGLVDRIFTRIGASDELSRGRSTFRVEIDEALQVLLHGSRRSLAIIDELGRGTGTFDGIAFSTAYLEYLYRHIRCRCLVSTHFFELTGLAARLPGVHNLHAAAKLDGERLIFSYRIQPGAADRSYGIEVARAAGMPRSLIQRAQQVLVELESAGQRPEIPLETGSNGAAVRHKEAMDPGVWELLKSLSKTDIMQLTPLDAMSILYELSQQAKALLEQLEKQGNG